MVKDDGLAAGKGVVVTADRQSARARGRRCWSPRTRRRCWSRSSDGPEVSLLFCLVDGTTVVPLLPARTSSGSVTATGPNTGGMGPMRRCRGCPTR